MSDKTYSEIKGVPAFDWRSVLDTARVHGMEASEHEKIYKLAAGWVTCACGNQCAIIPRNSDGTPFDSLLSSYGMYFANYVLHGEWKDAQETLLSIEHRSKILIAEELAKLNTFK